MSATTATVTAAVVMESQWLYRPNKVSGDSDSDNSSDRSERNSNKKLFTTSMRCSNCGGGCSIFFSFKPVCLMCQVMRSLGDPQERSGAEELRSDRP
jgi:hypothetical protein